VEKTRAAGRGTFYWMSLSDGNDRAIPRWTQSELKDAIVKGYYGEEGYKYYKQGDVNLDGSIDISDVVAIINQMAGYANYPYANVNNDDSVDISYVVAVINIMSQGY
jgi:ABC-type thiamine transport system substrate-binding protein